MLVRLLSGQPADQALAALRFLEERTAEGGRFRVSDLELAEAYYAFQHHYGVTKRETLQALRAFLATPGIEAGGEAAAVLEMPGLETANPGFLDRVILSGYLRPGAAQRLTFERASSKLPGVRVLSA